MGRQALRLFGCCLLLLAAGCGRLTLPVGQQSGQATPATAPPSSPAAAAGTPATSQPPSLAEAYRSVRSGVVRFEVAGCTSSAIGSGFAISPRLVATVAHVVADGQVIRVIQGTTSTAGTVIGIDRSTDVALVRTVAPLSGQRLRFATTLPKVGDQVAAIGFPDGDPLSFNAGTVNGLHRKALVDGVPRHGLIEMDAATDPGSSGGPVIDVHGDVVGLVDAGPLGEPGRRLAVSAETAQPLIEGWRAVPQSVDAGTCDSVLGPDGRPLPAGDFPTQEAAQAFATLDIYFRSINDGDFPTALAQLWHPDSLASFRAGVESTQDTDLTAQSVTRRGGTVLVWLTFTSHQDPGRGPAARPNETCTRWSLDYQFRRYHGLWLIASTRAHGPGGPSEPCGAAGTPAP
ncbi:MAG TPA: S1C family serine protease [Streptosporangiales bacterium]